jgi:methyl-accepting chemotaxis protein
MKINETDISAISEEINSASEEVVASAQNLTISTNEMNEQLKFFKIK